MGMGFAPTWLRHMSPLLHVTTLTTARAPGKGVCGGRKFLPTPYYSQRGLCASMVGAAAGRNF